MNVYGCCFIYLSIADSKFFILLSTAPGQILLMFILVVKIIERNEIPNFTFRVILKNQF
jgi:hypothetical protein